MAAAAARLLLVDGHGDRVALGSVLFKRQQLDRVAEEGARELRARDARLLAHIVPEQHLQRQVGRVDHRLNVAERRARRAGRGGHLQPVGVDSEQVKPRAVAEGHLLEPLRNPLESGHVALRRRLVDLLDVVLHRLAQDRIDHTVDLEVAGFIRWRDGFGGLLQCFTLIHPPHLALDHGERVL